MMEKIGVIWPNQKSFGAHINISGGGMLKTAPNKDSAVRFLEYLARRRTALFRRRQQRMAGGGSVVVKNPALDAMGKFKARQPAGRDAGQKCRRQRSASTIAPAGNNR
jgi:iron(III) transport system substrate-binding protein